MNMLSKFKKISAIMLFINLLFECQVFMSGEQFRPSNRTLGLSGSQTQAIENYIGIQMENGKIPGMAVVIVKGDTIEYVKGFGYANIKSKQPVTTRTLFELGSTSKAFTGLAILQLQDKKRLDLNDPVRKYIPWLKLKYQGNEVDHTIEQFLYQTSGVPFQSIAKIPEAGGDNALENTVKTLVGVQLTHVPGERFVYATINYDVLGLVIQKVSGLPFEQYMKTELLEPLGLDNTYLFRDETRLLGMATGYKISFGQARQYDAPEYRGNTPAGYFITNAEDMARWLKIQMQMTGLPGFNMELIKESHEPNVKVGSSYAAGWYVVKRRGEEGEGEDIIYHAGGNPNFSSFILFHPKKKLGVAVLANIRSSYVLDIPAGVLRILMGKEPIFTVEDQILAVDHISVVIIIVSVVLSLIIMVFLAVFFVRLSRKTRKFRGIRPKSVFIFLLYTLLLVVLYFLLYRISAFLFWGLDWEFVLIWGPESLLYAVIGIVVASFLLYWYLLLRYFFPKEKQIVR